MFSKVHATLENESRMNPPTSVTGYSAKGGRTIEVDGRDVPEGIRSVVFLVDGRHLVSGGLGCKIRRWRVKSGKEALAPTHVASIICNLTVSPDGKWFVAGMSCGQVIAWGTSRMGRRDLPVGATVHNDWVRAVDVSPDSTRIASGSYDRSVCIWSLPIEPNKLPRCRRLLGPLQHDWSLAAVKFSPDGRLIGTATWGFKSVRIYDSQHGRLLVEFPVQVNSSENQSLAWASDSKRLFAISRDGDIHCLDVHSKTTISQWPVHGPAHLRSCIALGCDDRVIAVSTGSSVLFWDTTTHERVGSVIEHPTLIVCMDISVNYDIAIGGGTEITLRNIREVLPSVYYDDTLSRSPGVVRGLKTLLLARPVNLFGCMTTTQVKACGLEKTVPELCHQERAASQRTVEEDVVLESAG